MKRHSDWAGPFCYALFLWGIAFYANLAYLIIACRVGEGQPEVAVILFTSDYFAGS